MTAQDIINRAFRWLGVLAEEEAMSAVQIADGLSALNDMMHGFGPMGIYYAHTTLVAADTVNVPDEQLRNVRLMLAGELATEYEVSLTAKKELQIDEAKRALQAAYPNDNPAVVDRALRSRRAGYFSFSRGE